MRDCGDGLYWGCGLYERRWGWVRRVGAGLGWGWRLSQPGWGMGVVMWDMGCGHAGLVVQCGRCVRMGEVGGVDGLAGCTYSSLCDMVSFELHLCGSK